MENSLDHQPTRIVDNSFRFKWKYSSINIVVGADNIFLNSLNKAAECCLAVSKSVDSTMLRGRLFCNGGQGYYLESPQQAGGLDQLESH